MSTTTQILGNITLINDDCMNVLRSLPDNAFDLAIVDPPYGMKQHGAENGGKGKLRHRVYNNGIIDNWDIAPKQEYFDELFRTTKNQIIWGGNYFDLPPTRGIIAWDKVQPWENFSQWEMAWTSFANPAKLFRFDNRTGDKIHPTQKPVALYKWLLSKYANRGDKILDTHLGSGSIAIACHDAGIELTGIELNKTYFNATEQRVKQHQQQLKLQL